jgi:hypothetical protein
MHDEVCELLVHRLAHAYEARQAVQLHSLGHLQPGQDFDCHGVVLGAGEKQLLGKHLS